MLSPIALITGPLVSISSWFPTAERLRAAGRTVYIPDALSSPGYVPGWRDWNRHLASQIPDTEPVLLVGHSSATSLIAELATRLPTQGLVLVDGEVPPPSGPASPVRPALHDFIATLPEENGRLLPWSQWFLADPQRAAVIGIDRLARDPAAFAAFEQTLPRMTKVWFAETIDLEPWSHIPACYIQISDIYDHAMAEAKARGWPVLRLQGTHMHPTLAPDEMAAAILKMSDALAER